MNMDNRIISTDVVTDAFEMAQNSFEENFTSRHLSDDEDDSDGSLAVIISNILLFLLIFGLSCTVDVKQLRSQLNNKFALSTGVLMQFLILPLLGFLTVLALSRLEPTQFTHAMGLSLLVVTSSPGGSYSNWWVSVFNADLALSVAMTTVSTVMALALLPGNLLLYNHLAYNDDDVVGALDFKALFISLGIVMGAIGSGLGTSYFVDKMSFRKMMNSFASLAGIGLILVSVVLSSGGKDMDETVTWWNQKWVFYVGVSLPCLAGMAISNALARMAGLKRPEIVAISIECCYQNTGIATSVAVTMFSDPHQRAQAVAVPLLYGFIEAAVIGIYCIWAWKVGWTKAPKNEKFCVVVSTMYDDTVPIDDEDHPYIPEADETRIPSPPPSTRRGWAFWRRRSHLAAEMDEARDTFDEKCELPRRKQTATSSVIGSDTLDTTVRGRFVSEDYTIATESPPETPVKESTTAVPMGAGQPPLLPASESKDEEVDV